GWRSNIRKAPRSSRAGVARTLQKKKGTALQRCPLVLRATRLPSNSRLPAVNITGRQRHPIEQVAYRRFFKGFRAMRSALRSEIVLAITNLIEGVKPRPDPGRT